MSEHETNSDPKSNRRKWNPWEIVAAFASVVALGLSAWGVTRASDASDKANDVADRSNRLTSSYLVTWYSEEQKPTPPPGPPPASIASELTPAPAQPRKKMVVIENRSFFPAHRVVLLNKTTRQYADVWVVNPCTRVTLDLHEKGEEVFSKGAGLYSLHFKMAGKHWKTDDDGNIVESTEGKEVDKLLSGESDPLSMTPVDDPLPSCG
ncbi:hypothetical protein [Streptomyces cavernae]|uniref:hypothetical protein n=1 Tax=Streptomyces cavernae TaxID=2259034 RepID=UPI000FEBBF92|nr:hypothetical protein [Streptomyces cavernae]